MHMQGGVRCVCSGQAESCASREKQCANEMQNWTWALLRAEVQGHRKTLFLKPGIKYFFYPKKSHMEHMRIGPKAFFTNGEKKHSTNEE